jgi:hypothetical protein
MLAFGMVWGEGIQDKAQEQLLVQLGPVLLKLVTWVHSDRRPL